MDLYIHCHVSSVACIKKICLSWNRITVYWNIKHFLYIVTLCSFNYMYGFSFGYYTHTYFLYMRIHIFSVAYRIKYVFLILHDQVIWCAVVFRLICVIWLVFFTWEQLCFCCAVWRCGFWICGAICIWCLWFQNTFFFSPPTWDQLCFCCIIWHCGGFLTCVAICPWCLWFQDVADLCWDVALYLLFCWKWICEWSGWFSNCCCIVRVCWCLAIQAG